MAGRTVSAIVTVVLIVLEMTADARRFHHVIERVVRVAIITGQLAMFSLKRKIGVACMVETGIRPRGWVVAGFALIATFSIVLVIVLMAAEAGIRCFRKCLQFVAVYARSLGMLADQFIFCGIVVEGNVVPAGLVVTIGTYFPWILHMWLVFDVAGCAGVIRVPVFFVWNVAIDTLEVSVIAEQFQVS